MRPEVKYTTYATSSKEQTGDVITFAQFEEGNLLSETRNDTESGDESNSESIMMTLNMQHQAQKGFRGIFVGIPQHQKGYLVYVPSTRTVILSYDVMFDEIFSSALLYTPQPYAEAMEMRPAVTYTPYATSSKEKTGNVIMFAQFEEGNLISENRNDTETSDESDSESIMMSEKDMENLDETEKFDDDLISTETLHDIRDRNQTPLRSTGDRKSVVE